MKNNQYLYRISIGILMAFLALLNAYVSYPDSSLISTFFLILAGLFLLFISIQNSIAYKKYRTMESK
ncbi:hypothetical protein [Priestia abyssalis]|uniref:hypothetical protein n=1 Tax=Priestia abyssalis TaxID=1221450 RepID=UPI000995A200|nr:hypothetical protein [Priestia abyssalis]